MAHPKSPLSLLRYLFTLLHCAHFSDLFTCSYYDTSGMLKALWQNFLLFSIFPPLFLLWKCAVRASSRCHMNVLALLIAESTIYSMLKAASLFKFKSDCFQDGNREGEETHSCCCNWIHGSRMEQMESWGLYLHTSTRLFGHSGFYLQVTGDRCSCLGAVGLAIL